MRSGGWSLHLPRGMRPPRPGLSLSERRPFWPVVVLTALLVAEVAALVAHLETARAAIASLSLLAGLLVVAAATAASRENRLRDMIVLRPLGVEVGLLRLAGIVEVAAVGLAAGILVVLVGTGSLWAVVWGILSVSWIPARGTIRGLVMVGVGGAAAVWLGHAWSGFCRPPWRQRNVGQPEA